MLENHSDHLEDNRFLDLPPVDFGLIPESFHWFCEQEDYLVDELIGFTQDEVKAIADVATRAQAIFERATDLILERNDLHKLEIPSFFHPAIYHSWKQRQDKQPFLYGRFDMSGGINNMPIKVIEYNADTCTMIPETLIWQPIHLAHAGKMMSYNKLERQLQSRLKALCSQYADTPVLLGTSLGHPEDKCNIKTILTSATSDTDYFRYYRNLEDVIFAEDGVYIEEEDGYIKVDILLKLFPWDWAYNEEPELAKTLQSLIIQDKVTILNPPYTTIWQNKMFLNYITQYFDNDIIAKSYEYIPRYSTSKIVAKSSHGRLGEEVSIIKQNNSNPKQHFTSKTYQEYLDLPRDDEGNFYQLGMFFTDQPAALNIRCSENPIINDDCEFYCHYLTA